MLGDVLQDQISEACSPEKFLVQGLGFRVRQVLGLEFSEYLRGVPFWDFLLQ